MQSLHSSSVKTRVLLLIESANLPTPEHLQPRARVLRADQLRPDQVREVAAEHNATSSTRSETHREMHLNGASFHAPDDAQNTENILGGALPPPEDVAPVGCGESIENLHEVLLSGFYEVQVLGSDLSPDALHDALRHALHEDHRPEVVVLEASRDVSVVAARCYEVKHEALCSHSSLLVVLPPAFLDSPNAPQTVAHLMAAGADDFLDCHAPPYELVARLSSLCSLARARHELAQTQQKLREMLQTDDLTHLLSRRFFFQMAHREYERALRYGHDLSCLMVDVNYLRRIIETMGFACGDAVLRHVAGIVREMAREVDIVGRFSDQKFVLLLPETDMAMAEKITEHIEREVVARPFLWQGKILPLSVSVGESTRRGETLVQETANKSPQVVQADQFVQTDSAQNANAQTENIEYSNLPETIERDAIERDAIETDILDLDDDAAPSLHEAVASLLEEADAALFVAKRGVHNNLMKTPMASPLLHTP